MSNDASLRCITQALAQRENGDQALVEGQCHADRKRPRGDKHPLWCKILQFECAAEALAMAMAMARCGVALFVGDEMTVGMRKASQISALISTRIDSSQLLQPEAPDAFQHLGPNLMSGKYVCDARSVDRPFW